MGSGSMAEQALRGSHPEPTRGREQAGVCVAARVRGGGAGRGARHCLSGPGPRQQQRHQELSVSGASTYAC